MPDGNRNVQTLPDGKCRCTDLRAFTRLSSIHVQVIVRSSDFWAFMSGLLWLHSLTELTVSSADFLSFSRLSCFQNQTHLLFGPSLVGGGGELYELYTQMVFYSVNFGRSIYSSLRVMIGVNGQPVQRRKRN